MTTIRDLKRQVLREAGCEIISCNFPQLSENHRTFWKKLNALGNKGLDLSPVVEDIDAAVVLSDEEYQALLQEFRSL